jgi:asparagine synthetase B (glutamine-hydrolysing)
MRPNFVPTVLFLQYEEIGEEVVGKLDGMFSFVLVDLRDDSFIAARDPLGITPLYLGWGIDGLFHSPFQRHLPLCLPYFHPE